MIEVKIRDTKSNMGKMLTRDKEIILIGRFQTEIFLADAFRLLEAFLDELKDLAKEDKQ